MQQLNVGATLQGGKYIIKRRLNDGGFGIVYLADNVFDHREIAIKEFFPKLYCNRREDGMVEIIGRDMMKVKWKFISEAQKIMQLNHARIVKVSDIFEENGTAYYVMDYIIGNSLSNILKERNLSLEESVDFILKIADALAHIHSHRMLHLDIKPANIMVDSSTREPVIIDFGVSKSYDEKGEANTTIVNLASEGYAPLEQLSGDLDSFSPQTDIYSLGALFYKMLTGFNAKYPTPQMTDHLEFGNEIPDKIIAIVKKSMAYYKKDRYANVADFVNALSLCERKDISSDGKPIINYFRVNKTQIGLKELLTVEWDIKNYDRIYLNGKLIENRISNKSIQYNTLGNKRLTLKAKNKEGEISKTIEIKVVTKNLVAKKEDTQLLQSPGLPPVIKLFAAYNENKIYVGEEVKVFWDVERADKIFINNEKVTNYGLKNKYKYVLVNKAGEIALTLSAYNQYGIAKKELYLTVQDLSNSAMKDERLISDKPECQTNNNPGINSN